VAAQDQPTEVTDEGVPTEAVEASKAVSEVEEAMEQVEEEIAEGLPAEFTIRFGDTHDWMRLTSGEWLKGKLKRMRDDEVEFDSDKLDLVTFDWKKVDQLHCPQVNTYVFEDKVDVVGRAVVTKTKVLVEAVDGVQSYPRDDLLSIVDGEPRERNWWSSKLGVGFSANAGNTNQGSLTAYFQVTRADYRTRSRLRYDGTVGYANKEQNVNRHIGTAEVRLYISHRWYFIPAAAQLLNDRFQNIHFRASPGAGAGIHVFDTKKVEWDLDTGLGYQYLDFLSTEAGFENPQNDGFVTFGTWAEFEFVEDVELELEWRTNLVYTTLGNTNHTARARFSVEITDIFDFETSFLFLRTEDPAPRADGTVPESNDYQLIVGLALELG
jgi:putative salt-induced outer membrane protein YdiY